MELIFEAISNSLKLKNAVNKYMNWQAFFWGFGIIITSNEIEVLNIIAACLFIEDFEFYVTALKWIGGYASLYVINLLVDIKIEFAS